MPTYTAISLRSVLNDPWGWEYGTGALTVSSCCSIDDIIAHAVSRQLGSLLTCSLHRPTITGYPPPIPRRPGRNSSVHLLLSFYAPSPHCKHTSMATFPRKQSRRLVSISRSHR